MTTYLGKSCSFGFLRMNCGQFMYLVISHFGFEGRMWDLIVSVPDHCLSFYFRYPGKVEKEKDRYVSRVGLIPILLSTTIPAWVPKVGYM